VVSDAYIELPVITSVFVTGIAGLAARGHVAGWVRVWLNDACGESVPYSTDGMQTATLWAPLFSAQRLPFAVLPVGDQQPALRQRAARCADCATQPGVTL